MQITLDDEEIKHALSEFVKSQGVTTKNRNVEVEISATYKQGKSGPRTYQAVINIGEKRLQTVDADTDEDDGPAVMKGPNFS